MPRHTKRKYKKKSTMSAKAIASKALSLARKVAKNNKPEWKVWDFNDSGNTSTTGDIMFVQSGLVQGTLGDDVVGDKYMLKKLTLRGYIQVHGSLQATPELVRVIVLLDREKAIGDTLSVTDVLKTAELWSLRNINDGHGRRYKFLYDKTMPMQGYSANLSSAPYGLRLFNKTFDLKNYQATLADSGAGTEANHGEGAIYVILMTNQGTYPSAWNLTARLKFTE